MSYIPKDAVTQAFRSNKGVLTPNQIIELDNENKFTKFGQLELIETQTVTSSVSTIEFTDLKDYNVHLFTVTDAQNSNDSKGIAFRLYESGTLESGSVYDTARQICSADGSFSENKSSTNSAMRIGDNTLKSSQPRTKINGYCYFYNLLDSARTSHTNQHSATFSNSGDFRSFFGTNVLPQKSHVNQIRVMAFDVGTIDSGSFSLYGIRFA
jgi:hypothetical protein|tara:strand:+ start:463 stop:1095 length:633 start_codon:yes stop_codon:yes gene_type:complete